VNLEAQYVGYKLAVPHMIKAGRGWIVNIASTQAIATEATVGAYPASKGAIVSFTKSLAVELAPYRINANAIAPGCIPKPMSIINGVDETTTEHFQACYVGKRKIPLGQVRRPKRLRVWPFSWPPTKRRTSPVTRWWPMAALPSRFDAPQEGANFETGKRAAGSQIKT
jgi:NAD(P)-dependent dehydrogenase (short-subunit alcohol dehydrogenase family)